MSWAKDDNPRELFEKLRDGGHEAVLLESGPTVKAGWSFVAIVNKNVKVPAGEKGLLFMREFLKKHKRPKKKGEPPFAAGFVGFLSYELGKKWQGVKVGHEISPSAYFVYVDKVFAFKKNTQQVAGPKNKGAGTKVTSNITRTQYLKKLAAIKKYLYSGDTYQVNLSQKFEAPLRGDAFDLYKNLTTINPSPFQFFLETKDFAVISNSPERLFKLNENKTIETSPIKGTVPRGENLQQERANIKKLLKSEKEAAELAMIVDLERNDLGKICTPGTVKVTQPRAIEKYSHVIHTVAHIQGKLAPKCDWLDALYALFPGGSVTGCPKKRTMEIIEELEKEPRGVYCGSAGYIDLSGNCDFNIMIRTLWLDKKENTLTYRSGGGIVVDSNPNHEYEETLHKAKAFISSLR